MLRSTLYVATAGSLKRLRTSLAASPRSSRSPSRISVWASPAEMRRPATASSRICWTGRPEGCRSIAALLYRILGAEWRSCTMKSHFRRPAEAENRPVSNLIETAALNRLHEQQFVDDAEMAEVLANEKLVTRLRTGSGQARARQGRLIE